MATPFLLVAAYLSHALITRSRRKPLGNPGRDPCHVCIVRRQGADARDAQEVAEVVNQPLLMLRQVALPSVGRRDHLQRNDSGDRSSRTCPPWIASVAAQWAAAMAAQTVVPAARPGIIPSGIRLDSFCPAPPPPSALHTLTSRASTRTGRHWPPSPRRTTCCGVDRAAGPRARRSEEGGGPGSPARRRRRA